jgi:hypothetical protein
VSNVRSHDTTDGHFRVKQQQNRYSNSTSPNRSDGDQNTHCQPKSDGEKAGGARIEPVQPISIACANASSRN